MRNFPVALLLLLLAALPAAAQPIADAGVGDDDTFVECTGSGVASLTLDGSGSFDPLGFDLAAYRWSGPFGHRFGRMVTVTLPLGPHEVTLEVEDIHGETSSITFIVIVIDTNPPLVDVTLFPSELLPNGVLEEISALVEVVDVCGAGTSYILTSVTDNFPATGQITGANTGAPDTSFNVLAVLSPSGKSRIYTATYLGTDASGNQASGSGQVVVNPDRSFVANPSVLTFDYTIGGPLPAGKSASIRSEVFTSFILAPTAPWIKPSPTKGNTPADVLVSVDPGGLAEGLYVETLHVQAGSGFVDKIQIRLRVHGAPNLFSLPDEVGLKFDTFTGKGGAVTQAAPVTTEVFIGARRSAAALRLSTDVPWLSAESRVPSTPARILVSAMPAGLAIGVHRGNVIISTDNTVSDSLSLPVELTVTSSAAFVAPAFVVNAATLKRLPVAPGSIITAYLFNPDGFTENATTLPLPTELGGLSGTVNGKPLRFFHVSAGQFNAQLPSDLEVGVAKMDLFFQGELAGSFTFPVIPAAPGVFASNGQALALNPDGTVNGPNRPVPKNSGVALFLTGQGLTTPLVPTGTAAPGSPFALPKLVVRVGIDGIGVLPLFAGLAPGQAGVMQVNVPTAGLGPGPHLVTILMGGVSSDAATIYVAQ